jgi:hypothetical protein
MIKSNNIKRYAKSKLYSDRDWNAVRDSALEYINNHPDIDIIQLQYWKGDKWYAFLTFYEYTK